MSERWKFRPLCIGNPEARKWMDEAVDCIAELEAENQRLKDEIENLDKEKQNAN